MLNRIITEIEKKIALRKRPVTRKGKTFWQKIPDDSIAAYRSYSTVKGHPIDLEQSGCH